MTPIAELEVAQIHWDSYLQINGSAAGIGDSLSRLFAVESADEAEQAYWGLENWVVAQGTVYSSAEPTISVLMASFLDDRIEPIRISALDLIYQILTGAANIYSTEAGNDGLMDRCRDRVREGLWLLVREAMSGLDEAALDVIELVDEERATQVRVWLGADE